MMANVRRRRVSFAVTGSRLSTPDAHDSVSEPAALHASSTRSSRLEADDRNRPATSVTMRFKSASVPTWLSNGPTDAAESTNVRSALAAIGER